jgi:hypothetical protein
VSKYVPYFDRSMADVYPKLGKGFKYLGYSILHRHSFDKTLNLKVQIEDLHLFLLNKAIESNANLSIGKIFSGTDMTIEAVPPKG